eukprot:TRINITY_DN9326_c0_g2_i1.p2 TRINITY_DN9326_c0_g2~~TRINITY_DN9326_c0_g2_i1.p2  ORF type:complete len:101 (-),score=9.12 TRINITY_DN9326_c0_g2_i1:214-516(-)
MMARMADSAPHVVDAYKCLNSQGCGSPSFRTTSRHPSSSASSPSTRPHSIVPRGSRLHHLLAGFPLLCLVGCTVGLGCSKMVSSYKKNKERSASFNPFLP